MKQNLFVAAIIIFTFLFSCSKSGRQGDSFISWDLRINLVDSTGKNIFKFPEYSKAPFDPEKSYAIDENNQLINFELQGLTSSGLDFVGGITPFQVAKYASYNIQKNLVLRLCFDPFRACDTLIVNDPDFVKGRGAKYIIFKNDTLIQDKSNTIYIPYKQ